MNRFHNELDRFSSELQIRLELDVSIININIEVYRKITPHIRMRGRVNSLGTSVLACSSSLVGGGMRVQDM